MTTCPSCHALNHYCYERQEKGYLKICTVCGEPICRVSEKMPYGKYHGKKVEEIYDLAYLEYLVGKKPPVYLLARIKDQISNLKLTHR